MLSALGALAGFDPKEMGGKSFRIGGATDMREALGDSSQLLIMQRGRWAMDIAQVLLLESSSQVTPGRIGGPRVSPSVEGPRRAMQGLGAAGAVILTTLPTAPSRDPPPARRTR